MKTTRKKNRRVMHAAAALLICFAAFLASGAVSSYAQTAASQVTVASPYAAASDNANRQAKEWIARGTPGLALAVAVDGKIVYSEGFGFADLEERVPVWPTTKFRIGSISKPLTAVGLMELVQSGKMDLDAPIQKYVPSFPDKGALITVRMVGGHLGGIRHYQGEEFVIQRHYANVTEGLAIFKNDPLVSPPGTKFNYSSYGFNLLSAAIESASGQDFLSYMQASVFTPMGLVHTTPDLNSQIVEQRSRFYELPEEWAGGKRSIRRQQLQVGRRRISLHCRRSRSLRLRASAARHPERAIPENHVHFAKNQRRRRNWIRHRLGHR